MRKWELRQETLSWSSYNFLVIDGSKVDTGHGHVKPKAPKLPDIYDVKDEINSTIFQFER